MKIVKLSSKNVKRLRAVEITPEGNVVVVGGRREHIVYTSMLARCSNPKRNVRWATPVEQANNRSPRRPS